MKKNLLRSLLAIFVLSLSAVVMVGCKKKEETKIDYDKILSMYIFEKDGTVVTDEFTLPASISNYNATWTSNSDLISLALKEVKDTNGNVTEKYYQATVGNPTTGTEDVTLTLAVGDKTKTFTLITRAIDVYDIADDYTFAYDKKTIESAFNLDTKHTFKGKEATIAWSVDTAYQENLVVDNNRCYVVCDNDFPEVKLSATFTYGGETATYKYRMTVNGSILVDALDIKDDVVVNTEYSFGFYNTNKATYYFPTGKMSGYYGATETDYSKAAKFKLEYAVKTPAQGETPAVYYTAEDTEEYKYNVSCMVGTDKKYLNMTLSGTHYNISFDAAATSAYALDADNNTLKANLGTATEPVYAFFGTYGTNITLGGSAWSYITSGNYIAQFFNCSKSDATPAEKVAKEKTDLVIANTNISESIKLPTPKTYKDVDVTWSIKTAVDGQKIENGVFKITRGDADKEVVLVATLRCGAAGTVDTKEITVNVLKAYAYEHAGTEADPYEGQDIIEYIKENVVDGGNSENKVYIKGKISSVVNAPKELTTGEEDYYYSSIDIIVLEGETKTTLRMKRGYADSSITTGINQNDTIVLYGLLNKSGTFMNMVPEDYDVYEKLAVIKSVEVGTSTVTVKDNSTELVKDLSITSGLNGATFTFTVDYELQELEEMAVKSNGTTLEAIEGVYTGKIAGDTVIEVTIIKPVDSYTLALKANGSNNSYGTNYDITVDGIEWNFPGNQFADNASRIGGKSLTGVDRYFYSKTALKCNVKKVTLTHGSSSVDVNSLTLKVYSTAKDAAEDTNAIATLTGTFTANSTTVFENKSETSWYGCFFRVTYNITVSQTSNKYLVFNSMKLEK